MQADENIERFISRNRLTAGCRQVNVRSSRSEDGVLDDSILPDDPAVVSGSREHQGRPRAVELQAEGHIRNGHPDRRQACARAARAGRACDQSRQRSGQLSGGAA